MCSLHLIGNEVIPNTDLILVHLQQQKSLCFTAV